MEQKVKDSIQLFILLCKPGGARRRTIRKAHYLYECYEDLLNQAQHERVEFQKVFNFKRIKSGGYQTLKLEFQHNILLMGVVFIVLTTLSFCGFGSDITRHLVIFDVLVVVGTIVGYLDFRRNKKRFLNQDFYDLPNGRVHRYLDSQAYGQNHWIIMRRIKKNRLQKEKEPKSDFLVQDCKVDDLTDELISEKN